MIIVVVWWLARRSEKNSGNTNTTVEVEEPKTSQISEEVVFNIQNKFETKLRDEVDFPDAIGGFEAYVYSKLMLTWYNKLAGANRYNDEMTQKLRNDWTDYMGAIEDRSTYNYLSMEFYDEKDNAKSESYREKHILASRKAFAIEDAFAAAVGKDAEAELEAVRARDRWDFDKFGNMAPEGHTFGLDGKPKKKKD